MSEILSEEASQESPDARFMAELRAGLAKVQQCNRCEQKFFQPRTHCPNCRSSSYRWVPLTMSGILHSFTNIPAQRERSAYNVVLVDMVDGFRMMSTCPDMVLEMSSIGMELEGRIDNEGSSPRIVFGGRI